MKICEGIDVAGIDDAGRKEVLGECKFKNEVIAKGVYEALRNMSSFEVSRVSEDHPGGLSPSLSVLNILEKLAKITYSYR